MSEALTPHTVGEPALLKWKVIFTRALGFGAAFALLAALLLGGAVWWSDRPKSWNENAIQGKPVDFVVYEKDDSVVVEFRYALTNHTGAEYQLPSTDMGALMGVLADGGSLTKLETASWATDLRIPPKQSIVAKFDSSFKFADYNTSKAELHSDPSVPKSEKDFPPALKTFLERRLKEFSGLVFLDYSAKYKIVLPSNWQDLHH